MNNRLNRRDFAQRTSAGIAGLVAGSLLGDLPAAEPAPPLDEKRLLLLGLNALARAPEMNYFADGHRGASLVAAHEMCLENQFDAPTKTRIAQLFDLNWAASPLCQPFPQADSLEKCADAGDSRIRNETHQSDAQDYGEGLQ